MKKKILSVFLAMAVFLSCTVNSAGAEATAEGGAETAETDADANSADGAAETTEAETEADGDLNEYGLTAEQQEALLESVKTTVTEDYLDKYGIAPGDFQIRPFDANDMKDYDDSGIYIGEDPYQFSSIWMLVDGIIQFKDDLYVEVVSRDVYGKDSRDVSFLLEDGYVFADTLKEQSEQNMEQTGNGMSFEGFPEKEYDLANSIYMGIAQFLNGLEEQERAELVYSRCLAEYHSEEVEINGMYYFTELMFDRVISDNIQF